MPRIVCLSDTHNQGTKVNVPFGDILLHAGDLTMTGQEKFIIRELDWLSSLPHKYKVFCAGNHDFYFDDKAPSEFRNWSLKRSHSKKQILAKYPDLIYLEASSVDILGYKIYGDPHQPWYYDWAFNFPLFDQYTKVVAEQCWARIPTDTNILLTHVPPDGILDKNQNPDDDHRGDSVLRLKLHRLMENNLVLHVFGHCHEGHGVMQYPNSRGDLTTFVNASICNIDYKPVQSPTIIDLPDLI